MRKNLYVFIRYRNPDLDDRISYLFTNIDGCVQAEDVRASFVFVGDLLMNGHPQQWLGSTTTNCHGVAAFDFDTNVSNCDPFFYRPTHTRGGTLDLMMTDIPDLVQVAVVAPIGNSDHSSMSAVVSMGIYNEVPNLCDSRKIFQKY